MKQSILSLNGKIWLEVDGEKVIGPGRIELLERVHSSGSIRQAAIQMEMSYNQAWKLIKHINEHFKSPVVVLTRGGKNGGNATVTENGLVLIKQFHALQQEFNKFLAGNISGIDISNQMI